MNENKLNEIKTIHEDDYILVLDKPVNLVVNRSQTTKSETLQDFIEKKYDFFRNFSTKSTSDGEELTEEELDEFTSRSGVLHRLDKDTSGVLLVAKDPFTFKFIKEQFKNRTVSKEYTAVVMGEVRDDKIEIDAPIKRNPASPLKFAVVEEGKPAITLVEKVKVIQKDDNKFTVINAYPKTGRTHQIRVHMAAINHPVVGDPIYLTKFTYELCAKYFNRLMLHSTKLTFVHPQSGQEVSFTSSLPSDFLVE